MNVRILFIVLVCVRVASAGVSDVQIRTDHVWYPGELAFSTFERLQATQAALYKHVVGHAPQFDGAIGTRVPHRFEHDHPLGPIRCGQAIAIRIAIKSSNDNVGPSVDPRRHYFETLARTQRKPTASLLT